MRVPSFMPGIPLTARKSYGPGKKDADEFPIRGIQTRRKHRKRRQRAADGKSDRPFVMCRCAEYAGKPRTCFIRFSEDNKDGRV